MEYASFFEVMPKLFVENLVTHSRIVVDTEVNREIIVENANVGGVKRISDLIDEEKRNVPKVFLESVIRTSVTYTEQVWCLTIVALDVVYSIRLKDKDGSCTGSAHKR